jgi:hypothetical protein
MTESRRFFLQVPARGYGSEHIQMVRLVADPCLKPGVGHGATLSRQLQCISPGRCLQKKSENIPGPMSAKTIETNPGHIPGPVPGKVTRQSIFLREAARAT